MQKVSELQGRSSLCWFGVITPLKLDFHTPERGVVDT